MTVCAAALETQQPLNAMLSPVFDLDTDGMNSLQGFP
jgi:hypothetical protein